MLAPVGLETYGHENNKTTWTEMYILFILPLPQHHESLLGVLTENVLVQREKLKMISLNTNKYGFCFQVKLDFVRQRSK